MRGRTTNKTPPGQRQLRVAERIRHILSGILREGNMRDPVLFNVSATITVTAVEIGPDLQHATAYVMPLGGKNVDEVVKALNRASGYFRTTMAPLIEMRYTPKVSFRVDKSFDEAEHITKILNQDRVRKDLEKEEEDDE